MIKISLILGLIISSAAFHPKKVVVTNWIKAFKVDPAFALKSEDSTFYFNGSKYLIETKVMFDAQEEVKTLLEDGDIDYYSWTQQEILKYKLLDEYSLKKNIELYILNDNLIKLNGIVLHVKTIDAVNKRIFYTLKNDNYLYRIDYK